MKAIVDGFNAPLTAGAFIDLTLKDFYKDLPINRAEEFSYCKQEIQLEKKLICRS